MLANPAAGRGRGARYLEQVRPLLAAGAAVEVLIPAGAQGATAAAQQAVGRARDNGADQVVLVALGGDGTVHLALQAAIAHAVPLAIIPAGSGNDAARELGLPLRDPVAAAQVVLAGATARIDTGQLCDAAGRCAHFLCVVSTGFDSAVNERANRMRWPGGTARYLRAVLEELRAYRAADYQVNIDGRKLADTGMLVSVGNGRSYGGGMLVCPQADLRDGLLDVIWLRRISRVEFLRTFPKVFTGRHIHHRAVKQFRGQEIELVAAGAVAYADGERFGPLPVTVRACPGSLTVVVGPSALP